jgi:hypothetical protein
VQAVALDELVDARLQGELLDGLDLASWARGCGLCGGRRLAAAAEVAEDGPPLRVDRVGVALIGLVEGLEEREVVSAERGLDIHGRPAVYSFGRG